MKNNRKTFLIYSFIVTFFNFSFSQCVGNEPILSLGNDKTICPSTSLILSAPSGYGFYNWSNNTHGKTISVNTSGTYSVEVGNVGTKNLVVNGDFESGNTSFSSSYTLGSGNIFSGLGPCENTGTYLITTDPKKAHTNFPKYTDHSVSGTKMMVVNGSGTPNSMVWSQAIKVNPNSDYILGAWIMTAKSDPAVANLQFFINGVQIGSVFNANPTQNIWEQFTNNWNSGSSTSAVLSIYNQNTVNTGNDFAIDDITFKAICKKTDEILITVSVPTQIITTTPATNCSGANDGSISITCVSAVDYSFDGGATWGVSNSKIGLAAGNYTVMSRNYGGCSVSEKVTLASLINYPTQTVTSKNSNGCFGSGNGSITISSPTAVDYSFDGGLTWGNSNSKIGLAAGNYTVMSRNSGGCSVSDKVTLASLINYPTQTVTSKNSNGCFGSGNGSITISSPTAVDYSFDGGLTWGNSNSKSNLLPISYIVLSRNSSGCTASSTVNLNGNTLPVLLTVSNDSTVCQNEIVTITAIASGGHSFTYVWDDFSSTISSQTFTPLQSKSYGVRAINQDGCESVKLFIRITVLNPLTATSSSNVAMCSKQSVSLSVSNISGGKAPYTVVWTHNLTPIGIGNTYSTNVQGTYVVIIRDNCSTQAMFPLTINVTESTGISPTFSIDDTKQCEPAIFKLTNTMDPSLIKSSVWKISNGAILKNQNDIVLNSLKSGSYEVKLVVETNDGCIDSTSVINALVVLPIPIANFSDSVIYSDQSSIKLNLVNSSVGAVSYEWIIPNATPAISTQKDFSTSFINNNLGEISVKLISKTDQHCIDSITKIIKIKTGLFFFSPNSFTPNGDGVNETWNLSLLGYSEKDFELSIFNRWGEMIWNSINSTEVWDGSYKSKKVPSGAYVWTMTAKDGQTNKKYFYKGVLNIVR
jgi:gliding motility-associated-like protein